MAYDRAGAAAPASSAGGMSAAAHGAERRAGRLCAAACITPATRPHSAPRSPHSPPTHHTPGDKLKGITGSDQAAAGMGIYGPRTVYLIAIKGYPGTHEFLLMDDGGRRCICWAVCHVAGSLA